MGIARTLGLAAAFFCASTPLGRSAYGNTKSGGATSSSAGATSEASGAEIAQALSTDTIDELRQEIQEERARKGLSSESVKLSLNDSSTKFWPLALRHTSPAQRARQSEIAKPKRKLGKDYRST